MSSARVVKNTKTSTSSGSISEIESKFIDTVSRLSLSMGLNRIVGQIYGLLYLRGKPLSLDEISESLQVSKGNVSVNIRELENWGAVKTVWIPGSRKDYYEANPDVVGIIYKRVRLRLEKTVSELETTISEWKSKEETSGILKERLKEVEKIKNVLEGVITLLPTEISGEQLNKKLGIISKLKSII